MGAVKQLGPIYENGVFVKLRNVTGASVVEVQTAQGNVSFKIGDLAYGEVLPLMDGRVSAQRTAYTLRRLSPERTEDDYPALSMGGDGSGFLVYQSFTPGIDRDERAKRWEKEPADLGFLSQPTGGDQLWLQTRSGNAWKPERMAVTEGGRDIYKSAVTTDGKGGAWIVWSERIDGNFEILARHYANGALGKIEKLTESAGNDLCPVAATGADGSVMVAWMAGANGKFEIRSRMLRDGAWAAESRVSSHDGHCWNPAIAAHGGRFALAWDT